MLRLRLMIVAPVFLETATETLEWDPRPNITSPSSTSSLIPLESQMRFVSHCDEIVESSLGIELKLEPLCLDGENMPTPKRAPKQRKFDLLSCVPTHLDRNFFDFPFFIDRKTYIYLNSADAKVMFIMRGLAGSGKSTLVHIIKSSYKHVAVCSADDFFYTPDGGYKFDEKLLSTAHSDCQHRAKQACKMKVPIVVIDNTNVKNWEMKFYNDLAKTCGYVVVTVQPKTPWKWNAEELAARNKHGVPVEILQRKVKMFDDVIPVYYGWFLSERKSKCLTQLCSDILSECLSHFPGLKNDLLRKLGIRHDHIDEETAKGILSEYYSQQGNQSPLLHCTSMFCGRGKVPKSSAYHQRADIQRACGQVFLLTISGFVITKNSLGARVSLGNLAPVFFNRPEEQEWNTASGNGSSEVNGDEDNFDDFEVSCSKRRGKNGTPKSQKKNKKNQRAMSENQGKNHSRFANSAKLKHSASADQNGSSKGHSFSVHKSKDGNNANDVDLGDEVVDLNGCSSHGNMVSLSELFPFLNYSTFSRSAHITVKTARGVGSREVNFDILQACDVEAAHRYRKSDFLPVQRGQAYYYGDGLCCVYFDKPLHVKTLFSGYY